LLLAVARCSALLISGLFVAAGATALMISPVMAAVTLGRGSDLLLVYGLVSIFWIALAPFSLQRFTPFGAQRLAGRLFALFLLFTTWLALLQANGLGKTFLLSVLLIVWVADTAAYFAGRAFGRHKLAPRVSPGKTWEGALGALVANLFLAVGMALWATGGPNNEPAAVMAASEPNLFYLLKEAVGWLPMLLLVVLLTFLSILGDLYESLLKRLAGVKDSGRVLPGHGGVLDRIDAVIPVFPVTMFLVSLVESGWVFP
jgi:phosphatidate cytidylyltransferase